MSCLILDIMVHALSTLSEELVQVKFIVCLLAILEHMNSMQFGVVSELSSSD